MASRPQVVPLQHRAIDNLQFIRATMERAGSFTAVPGAGGIAMGLSAFAAAFTAASHPGAFLGLWLGEAMIALSIGVLAIAWKARALKVPLASGPARKFALGLAPSLLVGALLTAALAATGARSLLPGIWLCMYGSGVVAGGAYSVRIVPVMGVAFLCLGGIALFTPAAWGNAWLATGFGGLHVVFGAIIAKKYGG